MAIHKYKHMFKLIQLTSSQIDKMLHDFVYEQIMTCLVKTACHPNLIVKKDFSIQFKAQSLQINTHQGKEDP